MRVPQAQILVELAKIQLALRMANMFLTMRGSQLETLLQ
jgi:hypothetical protein